MPIRQLADTYLQFCGLTLFVLFNALTCKIWIFLCMIICIICACSSVTSQLYICCMLICDFVESTIVCRNKIPIGLMLCHVSHIRRKINLLYLYKSVSAIAGRKFRCCSDWPGMGCLVAMITFVSHYLCYDGYSWHTLARKNSY